MARCLRCKAGNEWIEGDVKPKSHPAPLTQERVREIAEPWMVSVPREPKPGLLCGDVAVSTDPRYAGLIFVRHADGVNWTTCAKMTPETWAMLASERSER